MNVTWKKTNEDHTIHDKYTLLHHASRTVMQMSQNHFTYLNDGTETYQKIKQGKNNYLLVVIIKFM